MAALEKVEAIQSSVGVTPEALESVIRICRSSTVQFVRAMEDHGQSVVNSPYGKIILDAAKIQLQRERAWLTPFGFETNIEAGNDIESQLAKAGERDDFIK